MGGAEGRGGGGDGNGSTFRNVISSVREKVSEESRGDMSLFPTLGF